MSLRWEPSLEIGIADVDEQHRELFRQVNDLLDAMRSRRGAEEVQRLLAFLERYIVEHFAAEERLMREAGYPGLGPHRVEHREFVRDFHSLRDDFEAAGPSPAVVVRLNVWLCGWLRRHASDTDQAMGRFLAERRAARPPAPI